MGHPAAEDGAGRRGLLVHVGVEVVTGGLGEALDVGQGDGVRPGADGRADLQVVEVELERVAPVDVAGGAGHPLAGDRGEYVGGALHGRGLEMVPDAPEAAHLLAAAGPSGPTVDQYRER